jgi:para-nitrobenzyl esterase
MKSNRRDFIKNAGVGAAGLSLASSPLAFSSCAKPAGKDDGQKLFIGDNIAVADTTYGKVRGYILRDIYYFLGIPYGADTSGANRFMPPQKPLPWTDTYEAIWWGNSAPQLTENLYANKIMAFRDHWNYDDVSEDCLRINVFTPGYGDGRKRPVLLWMHGGGFTSGNGLEHDGYNGENIARSGDIVFCSVNHRLGPLGCSDFSSVGGEKYASSGNVGMLDLIAALEWIRDNISNFGGDPGNVTIIGQSGGTQKVSTTISMPASKGLVHKAVLLSTTSVKVGEQDPAQKLGAYILKEAGLKSSEIDKLQQMPWKEYYVLAQKAAVKLNEEARNSGITGFRANFGPHIDGINILRHPYFPDASPNAAEIPIIICSALNECSPSLLDPSVEDISFDGVISNLVKNEVLLAPGGQAITGLSKEKAEEVVNAYRKAFPDKKPVVIWSMITRHRQATNHIADIKSKQDPPVYIAWFGWQPPLFDNRLRDFHCVDICYWFNNTDLMLSHTGGGARPKALSQKMAGSLVQFMKTGDPNGGGLPQWPRYTPEKGELMFLDDVCEVQNDPDREARKTLPPII